METSELTQPQNTTGWLESGELWIWLTAGAVATSMLAVVGVVLLITVNGLAQFWPQTVYAFSYENGADGQTHVYAQIVEEANTNVENTNLAASADASTGGSAAPRLLLKTGNRTVHPPDYRWIFSSDILEQRIPQTVMVVERNTFGNVYGTPVSLLLGAANTLITEHAHLTERISVQIDRADDIRDAIKGIEQGRMREIAEQIRSQTLAEDGAQELRRLQNEMQVAQAERQILLQELDQDLLTIRSAQGTLIEIPVANIVRVWQPNRMRGEEKLLHFFTGLVHFLTKDPREASTEGGVFPAIFGTILLVMLMSILVTPLGVIAAIYLHEYAQKGWFVNAIRIAVNNLAGVPSIVYGVFGLGFFVYFLGGNLDQLFFSDALPAPTFGTPGLLWASLTLALLTMPVVIVSTEEGLARIPRSLREGSFALGATKAETLFRVILPMASPAILTGIILAVARAAGEVAPLMLVGVVKLAPTLPIDSSFPYIHLEQKFMHLGYHIYNVGFQTSNIAAARPVVYATALLLVFIIVALNLAAITLRRRLENRYRSSDL